MQRMSMAGCIFCGRTPLAREHLWPDWLRRELAIEVEEPTVSIVAITIGVLTVRDAIGRLTGGAPEPL